MIHVPAHKVRQFGVEFYQTSFTSGEWRKKLAGGTRGTVELLARELRDAIKD